MIYVSQTSPWGPPDTPHFYSPPQPPREYGESKNMDHLGGPPGLVWETLICIMDCDFNQKIQWYDIWVTTPISGQTIWGKEHVLIQSAAALTRQWGTSGMRTTVDNISAPHHFEWNCVKCFSDAWNANPATNLLEDLLSGLYVDQHHTQDKAPAG